MYVRKPINPVYVLFIDNLPSYVDYRWLRMVFGRHGYVLNAFVSKKWRRGRKGSFGFVRFGSRVEAMNVVRGCNGVFIGKSKIFVRMNASNQEPMKKGGSPQLEIGKVRTNEKWVTKKQDEEDDQSKRRDEDFYRSNALHVKHEENKLEILKAVTVKDDWLSRCVVGRVKSIELVSGIQEAFLRQGVLDISVAPMGGTLVLLEFPTVEIKESYKRDSWLSFWFNELMAWNTEIVGKERIIWIAIRGVPLHAWDVSNFRVIAERFGDVLAIDSNTSSKKFLDMGRVLISTGLRERIAKELIFEVDSANYLLYVTEEDGVRVSASSKINSGNQCLHLEDSLDSFSSDEKGADGTPVNKGISDSYVRKENDMVNEVEGFQGVEKVGLHFGNGKMFHNSSKMEPSMETKNIMGKGVSQDACRIYVENLNSIDVIKGAVDSGACGEAGTESVLGEDVREQGKDIGYSGQNKEEMFNCESGLRPYQTKGGLGLDCELGLIHGLDSLPENQFLDSSRELEEISTGEKLENKEKHSNGQEEGSESDNDVVEKVVELGNNVDSGCISKRSLDDAAGIDAGRVVSYEVEGVESNEDILIKDLLKRRSKKNKKWKRKKSMMLEDLFGKKRVNSGRKKKLKGKGKVLLSKGNENSDSDEGKRNRIDIEEDTAHGKKLMWEEAKKTWEMGLSLGLTCPSGEDLVIQKIVQIQERENKLHHVGRDDFVNESS